jgi:glycosyltransferase involved in cell wall biosynthesis
MNPLKYAVQKVNADVEDRPLNILCFPTHEGYQSLLDKTGHNFILLERPGAKVWETKYREIPENHIPIGNQLINFWDIDLVLSQDRFGQLQYARELSKQGRVPIVHVEHIEPQLDRWTKEHFREMQALRGDRHVYITEHNMVKWQTSHDGKSQFSPWNDRVIPHGIDSSVFKGWQPKDASNGGYVLYVVNYLKDRDYFCGYKQWDAVRQLVQAQLPNIEFRLVGDNPGLGSPVNDPEELAEQYRGCLAYINTSQLSPIPMSLMEAMCSGCPIITSEKQEIPKVVKHGINGYMTNSVEDMANHILHAIKTQQEAAMLGEQARLTIKQQFGMQQFIDNWNEVFYDVLRTKGGLGTLYGQGMGK